MTLLAVMLALAIPASASGARPATTDETAAILEVFNQDITPDRWFCWSVMVSTVMEKWATVRSAKVSDDPFEQIEICPETADGHAVFEYVYGGWEESWQASEPVSCDWKRMPGAVGRDLGAPGFPICRAPKSFVMCASEQTEPRWPAEKPRRCNTSGRQQGYAGSANLTRLRWRGWGTRRAKATGIERGFKRPAENISVRVRAFRPRRDCMGDRVYTRMRVSSRHGSTLIRFGAREAFGGRCPEA